MAYDQSPTNIDYRICAHPDKEGLDLAFSADGATIATSGSDNYIRFWDAEYGTEKHQLAMTGMVNCIDF